MSLSLLGTFRRRSRTANRRCAPSRARLVARLQRKAGFLVSARCPLVTKSLSGKTFCRRVQSPRCAIFLGAGRVLGGLQFFVERVPAGENRFIRVQLSSCIRPRNYSTNCRYGFSEGSATRTIVVNQIVGFCHNTSYAAEPICRNSILTRYCQRYSSNSIIPRICGNTWDLLILK